MGSTGVGKEDDDDDVDCPKAGVENRGMAMERMRRRSMRMVHRPRRRKLLLQL